MLVGVVRSKKNNGSGLVEVVGVVVQVHDGWRVQMTVDYQVRGQWLRTTVPWIHGRASLPLPPGPGSPLLLLVDPDNPERTPALGGLDADSTAAVALGIIAGLLLLVIVVIVVLVVVL